jgi:hypothetical protein
MVSKVIERFVWQRRADGSGYAWDVKLRLLVTDEQRAAGMNDTVTDALTPDMAAEQFGFRKADAKKVLDPFLLADAMAARAALSAAEADAAKAAGEAKATEAALRARIRELEAAAAPAAAE